MNQWSESSIKFLEKAAKSLLSLLDPEVLAQEGGRDEKLFPGEVLAVK